MYAVHPISQPNSNYIEQYNGLSIYLMGALWLVFLTVFVNFSCDVRYSDTVICTTVSPVSCFIDDYPISEILNHIHQVTSKRQRCASIAFIDRNKEQVRDSFTFS